MQLTVCRKEHFNAAHRLYNKNWTDEQNDAFYGKCANKNYHGHNYDLIVKVTGELDPETGYVIDMKYLSDIIETEILEKFDHKNLNLDTEEFKELIPTAENIARVIHQKLYAKLGEKYFIRVILFETARNFVEFPPVL